MANTTGIVYPRENDVRDQEISDDPDVIRQQIAHTRVRMSETINEIGERLSPDYILDKAKTSVREATVGRFKEMGYEANRRMEDVSSSMGDTVRSNPLPVALIGIGLGWLLMSQRSKRESYDNRNYGYRTTGYRYYEGGQGPGRMEQARYRVGEAADDMQYRAAEMGNRVSYRAQQFGENVSDTAQQVGDNVRETAQEIGDNLRGTAQRTTEAVRDTAQRVGETVSNRAEMVQERASDMSMQARHEAERLAAEARWRAQQGIQQTRQTFWEVMENNPLTLGAVVLMAGAAVGAAIPSTEYENRLLGETRDKLVEEARTRAQGTVERVQTVLQDAQQAAVTEVKRAAEREDLPTGNSDEGGDTGSSNW